MISSSKYGFWRMVNQELSTAEPFLLKKQRERERREL
jgi:hypothetical protein